MSVGGSSADHPVMLISEPNAGVRTVPTMVASAVTETSVTLTWTLAKRCPVSWPAFSAGNGAVDCDGVTSAVGLSYQVYVFPSAALQAGEHVTSPCALDANAQSDVNGPFPLGFAATPGMACTTDYTRVAVGSFNDCAALCDRSECGGFT